MSRLHIHEIYISVQGESTWSGQPCVFVRLTGCPLRCTYCDTAYAFTGGTRMEIDDVISQVASYGCNLVEVTGGEPLAQPNCRDLLEELVDRGYTVLLETSGALPIAEVPKPVHVIMDLKCPSSGELDRNLPENLPLLLYHHEVKFVLGTREDYEWAKGQIAEYHLDTRCRAVLMSCVFGQLEPAQLVDWIIADKLHGVRFQLQAHKFIWDPAARGV